MKISEPEAGLSGNATGNQAHIRWHEFSNSRTLFDAAFVTVSALAKEAIAARNAFRLVLAGGHTPVPLYRRLSRLDTDWRAWHLYFGDERCLPRDHPERNSSLINQAWLKE